GTACHLDRPSFPTRRSSDLGYRRSQPLPAFVPLPENHALVSNIAERQADVVAALRREPVGPGGGAANCAVVVEGEVGAGFGLTRSEEHTSELQSRENLVCRL